MVTPKKTGRGGKREKFLEEARSLYLAGKSLEEIQAVLPVALTTLRRWGKDGQWEEKRRQVATSPRWLGEALKGVLREKAGRLLAKGDLLPAEVEELARITTLIDRLTSQGWDLRAAALEVMERFIEFVRERVDDPEEIKRFSGWLHQFFRRLEENGEGDG